jgi:sterol 3beta-glucosyltransferase
MRVGIIALRSTGDVLPFAGLGQALAEAGHVVTIAAHSGFENPIRDAGLTVAELPLNPRNVDSDVQAQIRKGGMLRCVPSRSSTCRKGRPLPRR